MKKMITVLVAAGIVSGTSIVNAALTINVDVDHGTTYSGTAVAPDSGTVWNSLSISDSPVSVTISDVSDSEGNTLTGVNVTMASHDGSSTIKRYATDNNTTPVPQNLMRDYSYSGTYDVTVTGLDAGTYDFWFFGHGDQTDQAGGVTVDASNGGGGGYTADDALGRDLFDGGDGVSYVYVSQVPVDATGIFAFQVANFINGFQLQSVATVAAPPVISDLNDQSVLVGSSLVLTPTVTGSPDPTFQWFSNGVALDGETNQTLALNNIQAAQDGTAYSLVADNSEGSATNSMTLTVTLTSGELPAFPGADGAGGYASGGRGGIVYHVTKLNSELDDPDRASYGTLVYGLNDSNFPNEPRTIVFDVAGVFHLGMGDTANWDSMGNAWDSQSRQSINATDLTIAGQTAPGPVIIMGGTLKPSGSNIVIRNITIAAGYGMKAFWEPPPKTPPTSPTVPTSYTMDAIDVSGQNIMLDHLDALYCSDETISCNENADNLTIQYCTSAMAQNYQGHGYGHLLQADTDHKMSFIHNFDAHIGNRLPRVGSEVGTGALNDFRNNVIYNWLGSRPGYAGSGQYSKNNFIRNFYLEGNGGDYGISSTQAGGTGAFNGASAVYTFVYANGNLHDTNRDGDPNDTTSADGLYQNSAMQSVAYNVNIGVTLDAAASFTNVMRYVGSRWWERDYDISLNNTDAIDTPNERLIHEAMTGTGRIEAWADDPYDTNDTDGVEWRSLWALRMDTNGVAPFNRPAGWDTDRDGMPDDWEAAHGLDPNVANNNDDFDTDGYTDLEEYLNDVAAWPAPGVIRYVGAANSRYAEMENWLVSGETLTIDGWGTVTTFSQWQPSRYDTVLINNSTCVVDAVGQHAGTLQLADDAVLDVTNGWLRVADRVDIGAGCTVAVQSSGSLSVTNNLVNTGTLRLTGSAELHVDGSIINNGVLDVMTWSGDLSDIVNNGIVLDYSLVQVDSAGVEGINVIVTIQGYTGHTYQLQYRDDLMNGAWTGIGVPVTGNGELIDLIDEGGASEGKRFYRVFVNP